MSRGLVKTNQTRRVGRKDEPFTRGACDSPDSHRPQPGFTRMHPPIVCLIPILTVNPAAFDTTAGAKAKEDMKSTP